MIRCAVLYFQWHVGYMANEYTPKYRGFDTHYGYYGGCDDYFDHSYRDDRPQGKEEKVCRTSLKHDSCSPKH